jgi:hypothetical protein
MTTDGVLDARRNPSLATVIVFDTTGQLNYHFWFATFTKTDNVNTITTQMYEDELSIEHIVVEGM